MEVGVGFWAVDFPRQPQTDCLPESPVDWEDIPLGAGQEPNVRGHFQFTRQGDATRQTDVRRSPGYESIVVDGQWPTRPI